MKFSDLFKNTYVEFNEQTELPSKVKTKPQTESRHTALLGWGVLGWGVLGWGVLVEGQGLSKKEKNDGTYEHGQQCYACRGREVLVEERISGDGKK